MARLQGMQQICDHYGKSESTMMMLIQSEDFPAVKIGGQWESDTEVIEEWRKERIRIAMNSKTKSKPKKGEGKKL